jgi:hypothetical protein
LTLADHPFAGPVSVTVFGDVPVIVAITEGGSPVQQAALPEELLELPDELLDELEEQHAQFE